MDLKEKKQKIKNKSYRNFLDNGIIQTLNEADIQKAMENIKGKHIKEARSLLIILYYSGARPNEILNLKAKDVEKKTESYITIKICGSKRGLPRTIYLPIKKKLVKEFLNYSLTIMPEMWLFYNYRSNHIRKIINRKGEEKKYIEITDALRYHFKKWFEKVVDGSLSPYFLRHNRFSKLAEQGIKLEDIRMLKGAKTFESITPYIHLSSNSAKNIAKKID